MNQFIEKYAAEISGMLTGFDRLVFRGTLRRLNFCRFDKGLKQFVGAGMENYLYANQILFKDYYDYVRKISKQIKETILEPLEAQGVPYHWAPDNSEEKSAIARRYAKERGVTSGMVCVVGATEPSPTFEHRGKHIIRRKRPCYVLYQYQIHPQFGWMHARLQTYFPFNIQVALNGREWLSRQMAQQGMKFIQEGNCFPWIEDFVKAQDLMNEQMKTNWGEVLNTIARSLNPQHESIFSRYPVDYYWTCDQSEWATDLVFRDPELLKRLSDRMVRYAVLNQSSADVMRYFGKKVNLSGEIPASFGGTLKMDLKRRKEGARVKFSLNGNSAKFYDKAYHELGNVLRVAETTLVNVKDFQAYRSKEGGPEEDLQWRPMRKGIADLHRRTEVSQKTNERLMNALASLDDSRSVQELTEGIQKRTTLGGRKVRGLRPWGADKELLTAINHGEFLINGFRNRNLRELLYGDGSVSAKEQKRQSAAISRKLRLLRAHGIVRKVSRTHRYQITDTGRAILAAVLMTASATVYELSRLGQAA